MGVYRGEVEPIKEAIDDGDHTTHIYGEPGVGKTQLLEQIRDELPYGSTMVTVRNGDSRSRVNQALLERLRNDSNRLSGLFNSLTSAGLGFSTPFGGVSASGGTDDRSRHIDELAKLSKSTGQYVLCIDDIHKLGKPPEVRDYLQELADEIDDSVQILSTGRIPIHDVDYSVELGSFTLGETRAFLTQEFPDIDEEEVREIHERLEGRPYFLGLLSGSEPPIELPEDDVRDFLERQYLDRLTEEEEELLIQTSCLMELDEEICASVLSISRATARQRLRSLEDKVVVRYLERADQTNHRVYSVHDLFREVLYERIDDPSTNHRAAFQYYADRIRDRIAGADMTTISLQGMMLSIFANQHLISIYGEKPAIEQVQAEISRLEYNPTDRLQFSMAYAPFTPSSESFSNALLTKEVDVYRGNLLEQNSEEADLDIQTQLLMVDVWRAQLRKTNDHEFSETVEDIREETYSRLSDLEFDQPVISDIFHLYVRFGLAEDNQSGDRFAAAFDILEKYGLEKEVSEQFVETCRSYLDGLDEEGEFEQVIQSQFESMFETSGGGELTRNALVRSQSEFYSELISWVNSAITAALRDSEGLLRLIHKAGNDLAEAENPIFVMLWYKEATTIANKFAPDSPAAQSLERAYETYFEERKEYEKSLKNPVIEVDELETGDLGEELPDLFSDIIDAPT